MTEEQAEANLKVLQQLKGLRDELGAAQVKTKHAATRHKDAKADESEVEQQIFALLATLQECGSEMKLPFDDHRPGDIRVERADGSTGPLTPSEILKVWNDGLVEKLPDLCENEDSRPDLEEIATALADGKFSPPVEEIVEEIECPVCGGFGGVSSMHSEHDPRCDGSCSIGCPVPVEHRERCEACGGSGKFADAFVASDDDPGPDPMDVAEANKDFSDHLAQSGRSLDD